MCILLHKRKSKFSFISARKNFRKRKTKHYCTGNAKIKNKFRHIDFINISLVVPVFNESKGVGIFYKKIQTIFSYHKYLKLELLFVNDGSNDDTLEQLLKLQLLDNRIVIIDLSRNFGKEAALTAGLYSAKGQVIVPIDVDLQDPPEIIFEMIPKWRQGYEVVLGHRKNRNSDTWFKRMSATIFYRLHNMIADNKIPANVGDFRLMDRCVVEALKQMPETRRFMKGLFAWAGFRTTCVDYIRDERSAGFTKFGGWRLWNFALEGFTGFSTAPLRVWTYLGGIASLFSFLLAAFIMLRVVFEGVDIPGYASMMVMIAFFGGLQLIGIGIIGEYLGRTYLESKRRPIYIVRKVYST